MHGIPNIVERSGLGLNILVTAGWSRPTPSGGEAGNTVTVRRNWSEVDEAEASGRCTHVIVPRLEAWDGGEYTFRPDWPGITAAVAQLRAAWGDLPCQINEWREGA